VKVRPDGTVKVLDFGLAKALEPIGMLSPSASMSPTITSPAMTLAGTILGTAAYMSPEQARGKPLDKRTDIWSFGCVLFEMLTGTRAFAGEDVSDTLAAVLRGEPEWSAIPPDVPAVVRTLIRRCLEKDRQQRIGDTSVVLFVLNEPTILGPTAIGKSSTMPKPTIWQRMALPVVAVLASAIVASFAVWFATRTSIVRPVVTRLLITPPRSAAPTITALSAIGAARDIAITPDGKRVIYLGANGTALFVRALDQLDAIPLTGLGTPVSPFVSPDGQWIGFVDATMLKRVAITGGPPTPLAALGAGFRGASWDLDGTIVFATTNTAVGLQRLPAGGGEPLELTRPDSTRGEADHLWPELLPGGHAVLFTITATTGGLDQAQVAVLDLLTMKQTTLIPGGSDAHYVPSGHLVYGAAGALRAIGFDLGRLEVVGTSVPVVPQVVTTSSGAVNAAVATDGTLVYVPGVGTREPHTLVWVDRMGQETPIAVEPRTWDQPRIAPDRSRVAVHNVDDGEIWLWNLVRGGLTRLTSYPGGSIYPVWTRDSRRILFASARAGAQNLFLQAADGTGTAERLTESPNIQRPTSFSPNDARLTFYEIRPKTDWDVLERRMGGAHEISALVDTQSTERNGEISPDGNWLAYESDESGKFNIYVRPFPDVTGGRWPVSADGGTQPVWAPSGGELFYLALTGELMRVAVPREAKWTETVSKKLLNQRYYAGTTSQVARMYDIDPDGSRFLMIKAGVRPDSTAPVSLVVVQQFDEELKRLVPVSK
jgi:serine/threonine-protein kinase